MIKLLQFLLSGCWHDWSFKENVIMMQWCGYNKKDVSVGTKRIYICKKCGSTKKHYY